MRRLIAAVVMCVLAASCAGAEEADEVAIRSVDDTSLEVDGLPDSDVPTASAEETTVAESTIPLNDDDQPALLGLLDALAVFNTCLDAEGFELIGLPDPTADPADPVNDTAYLAALQRCAARSDIQDALDATQAEQDNLTPTEIEQRNQGYLLWRECMIGRGWGIPEPVPDANGLLGAFGAGTAGALEPPPGEDVLSSDDLRECTERAVSELADEAAATDDGEDEP
ncbi:MAG: hypothetical protein ACE5GB_00920 [Acidimicrobiales bacterium]